jgi:probable HAF family extracellular repeat protein
MKSKFRMLLAAITFSAALALLFAALALPLRLAAQDKQDHNRRHHHYRLIDMGTFGGPSSYFNIDSQVLNNHGTLAGWADTSTPDPYPGFCFNLDCFVSHAFQRQEGVLTDLGTLPGGSSSQALWIASNGLTVGNSQNGETDPLIPGLPETRAVLWSDGQIIDLGTFGGNESISYAVSSRGQVVGAALNTTPDPFSFIDLVFHNSSNGTQTRAFSWQDGVMEDLGTLGTGTDALAFFVNEAGQVAGLSYTNSIPNPTTGLPTFHAFLWEKGKGMRDLGSFGGTQVFQIGELNQRGQVVGSLTLPGDATWHPFLWDGQELIDLGTFGGDIGYGNWVNDAGEVVGQAAFPGDQVFHGFLWKNGMMSDLGLLPGDSESEPFVINSRHQIVGLSKNSTSSRAVLWEHGQIFDLNTLLAPGSGLYLFIAWYISDRGEIAASGVLPNGDQHAVLLIPCGEGDESCEGENPTGERPKVVLPENVRKFLQQRRGFGRFGLGR